MKKIILYIQTLIALLLVKDRYHIANLLLNLIPRKSRKKLVYKVQKGFYYEKSGQYYNALKFYNDAIKLCKSAKNFNDDEKSYVLKYILYGKKNIFLTTRKNTKAKIYFEYLEKISFDENNINAIFFHLFPIFKKISWNKEKEDSIVI